MSPKSSKDDKNILAIRRFCKSQEISDFFRLNKSIRKLFVEAARYINSGAIRYFHSEQFYCPPGKIRNPWTNYCVKIDGKIGKTLIAAREKEFKKKDTLSHAFKGLASIIINATTSSDYYKLKEINGIDELQLLYSNRYKMKVLIMGDSHTRKFNCKYDWPQVKSAVDFIKQELNTATCFIDLYLEVPFISRGSRPKEVRGCQLDDIHTLLYDCFRSTNKKCRYPYLRAHYIDTRTSLFLGHEVKELYKGIVLMFYNPQLIDTHISIWSRRHFLQNKKLQKIFKNRDSLSKYLTRIIAHSKISKQMKNIKYPEVKKLLGNFQQQWIHETLLNHGETLEWHNIKRILLEKNKSGIKKLYYAMAYTLASVMDAYTVGRIFRTFKYTPYENSQMPKNIIIVGGNFHTRRYLELFLELGFRTIFASRAKASDSCVSLMRHWLYSPYNNLQQPIFRSPEATTIFTDSPLPSTPSNVQSQKCKRITGCAKKRGHKGPCRYHYTKK